METQDTLYSLRHIHQPVKSQVLQETSTTSCAKVVFCKQLDLQKRTLPLNALNHVQSHAEKIALAVTRMSC